MYREGLQTDVYEHTMYRHTSQSLTCTLSNGHAHPHGAHLAPAKRTAQLIIKLYHSTENIAVSINFISRATSWSVTTEHFLSNHPKKLFGKGTLLCDLGSPGHAHTFSLKSCWSSQGLADADLLVVSLMPSPSL